MAHGLFSGWLNFTLVRDTHYEREICGLVQKLLPTIAPSLSCPRRSQRSIHNVSEFSAYLSVVEQLGWLNAHIVPQAMQLTQLDGRPDPTLRVQRLMGSSSDAVKEQVRGILTRNQSDIVGIGAARTLVLRRLTVFTQRQRVITRLVTTVRFPPTCSYAHAAWCLSTTAVLASRSIQCANGRGSHAMPPRMDSWSSPWAGLGLRQLDPHG
eukprot:CAMPEP_0115853238 /NCGR_PEP_ID=MMETSP0287-20121206/13401_1 /TAXON_ID=412157 /ORGANISM="Chrysochromulina rotalis, Strain UIO044" /LENGTH=209 /DNA_ID=CAMNT_0003307309 /DNA_START=53 /DNA_END=678 /DNA_ORIENTATION=-